MIRNFLLWVPNFPAVLSRDTQPFFIPLLLMELRLTPVGVWLFLCFLGLSFVDGLLSLTNYSISAHVMWILTGAFTILLPYNTRVIQELVDKWKIYLGLVLFLTAVVFFSSLDALFTSRNGGVLNFTRSWPLIYPEASYAAKHLFLFAIIYNRLAPKPMIVLAILPAVTASATGVFLSLLLFGLFSVSRLTPSLFLRNMLAMVVTIAILSQVEVGGRAGIFVDAFFTLNLDTISYLLEQDQSFQTRLSSLSSDEFVFNSLFQFFRVFTLSGVFLIGVLLVTGFVNKAPWFVYLENTALLMVIGYADTFFYPFLFFALKSMPVAQERSVYTSPVAAPDVRVPVHS